MISALSNSRTLVYACLHANIVFLVDNNRSPLCPLDENIGFCPLVFVPRCLSLVQMPGLDQVGTEHTVSGCGRMLEDCERPVCLSKRSSSCEDELLVAPSRPHVIQHTMARTNQHYHNTASSCRSSNPSWEVQYLDRVSCGDMIRCNKSAAAG